MRGRLCRLAGGHDWLLEGFFSRMRHRVGGDPAELRWPRIQTGGGVQAQAGEGDQFGGRGESGAG